VTEGSALTVTSYVCFELGNDFIHGSKLGMLSLTNQMLSLRDTAAELLEGDQKHDTALPKRLFSTLLTSLQMCILNICELKQNKFTSFNITMGGRMVCQKLSSLMLSSSRSQVQSCSRHCVAICSSVQNPSKECGVLWLAVLKTWS